MVGDVLDGRRKDPISETEKILEDLESTLDEAISRPRWSERRRSAERARNMAEQGQHVVPILKETVIEDLQRLAKGERLRDVNNGRQKMVVDMYEKVGKGENMEEELFPDEETY